MFTVLFICVGNSCRSQMAEGFMRHYGGDSVEVLSAGTVPAEQVSGKAVEVMKEKGIDISGQSPSAIDVDTIHRADRVISMGCGVEETCPANILGDTVDWGIDDPHGHEIDMYRDARDEIEGKVLTLLEDLAFTEEE